MKLSIFIILIPTPDFPHFYYMLGRNLGSLLYRDVTVMYNCTRRLRYFSGPHPEHSNYFNILFCRINEIFAEQLKNNILFCFSSLARS